MSDTPLTDSLRSRWEAIEAERRKALGPNPKVAHSISVAAGNFLDLIEEAAIFQKNNFGQLD